MSSPKLLFYYTSIILLYFNLSSLVIHRLLKTQYDILYTMTNYNLDVGSNATKLGFAYLALRYLLPVIVVIGLIILFPLIAGYIIIACSFLMRFLRNRLNISQTELIGFFTLGVLVLIIFGI